MKISPKNRLLTHKVIKVIERSIRIYERPVSDVIVSRLRDSDLWGWT